MRRAQAALEFLSTYGWALLVILVMIGAFSYLGVFNQASRQPARCDAEVGFDCQDSIIRENSLELRVQNVESKAITNITVTEARIGGATLDNNDMSCRANETAAKDEPFTVRCDSNLGAFYSKGDPGKAEVRIAYIPAGSPFQKVIDIQAVGSVQERDAVAEMMLGGGEDFNCSVCWDLISGDYVGGSIPGCEDCSGWAVPPPGGVPEMPVP